MMHVTFSDKTLLVGDEIAQLLLEYAAALARTGGADTVRVQAYGADADKVVAMLLLDEGAPLMAETTHTDLPAPDNEEAAAYIRECMGVIATQHAAQPVEDADVIAHLDSEWTDR
jgi:hypothetical protein